VLVDLHAHYPMHLYPEARTRVGRRLRRSHGFWRLLRSRQRAWFRALLIGLASLFINYRSIFSGPRVRMSYMRKGEVGVALSVLYSFFDEIDLDHGVVPEPGYIETLIEQMEVVEDHVAEHHDREAEVTPNPERLADARRAGKVAIVHCVEGGFHLGGDAEQVRRAVARLAERGVAYITLAHLIWREVATDAPALPFMSDAAYRQWFPQPEEGLSPLGEAAVRAMHERRVLIDLSHMSARALEDTFALLDELDSDRSTPVMATHAGYRFGTQEYMLAASTIERIKERDGVVGLIFAQHQLYDGLVEGPRSPSPPPPPRLPKPGSFEDSVALLRTHIDRIRDITGSHRHTAVGSDLDGFIKPTLPHLEDMRDMAPLQQALRGAYGDDDAELICSGNGMRLLTEYWGGGPGRA
jgi:microsomal dipeptidase-like Zn-dependent dipeptidase